MKRFYSSLLLFMLLLGINVNAQNHSPNNDHSGHNHAPGEPCKFDQLHQEKMRTDAEYKRITDEINHKIATGQLIPKKSGTILQVPVVVHVLHTGEALGTGWNISDQQVQDGIKSLNQFWRRISGTPGFGGGVDMEVEFALAVRDPSGNCTNGIVRRNMSSFSAYVNNGVGSGGITEADAKTGRWNTNDYYNIYLVNKIDGNNCFSGGGYTAGYAYFPSAHGSSVDGTVCLICSYVDERDNTMAHELGHAFGLFHTFEACSESDCSTGGDRVCDTRPHQQSDCSSTSCTGSGTFDNSRFNYMSYCNTTERFTDGQKTRARSFFSDLARRGRFLAANGNNKLIPPSAPTVDFVASATAVCLNSSVRFTDKSFCIPNTYATSTGWPNHTFSWSVTGPANLNSTLQNPSFTFTVAGTYNVTLTITNNQGTFSTTKNSYIVVSDGPVVACSPSSNNVGCFSLAVSNVTLNTINNSTGSCNNPAYNNFSCTHTTILDASTAYNLSVSLIGGGSGYSEYLEVWIDWDNSGTFQTSNSFGVNERVLIGNTNSTQTFTTSITPPASAVKDRILRMRVMGEAGNSDPFTNNKRNCTQNYFVGDIEDYGVLVKQSCLPPAQPGAITGPTSVCANQTGVAYSIGSVSGATSYTWSVPAGATVASGQGSTAITVNFGTSSGDISVTANDACGSSTARTLAVTVNNPTITGVTNGSRCGTGSVTLGATASTGTINWYANSTGGSSLGTGGTFNTPSISTTTSYWVDATSSGCTTPTRTQVIATINNIPGATSLSVPANGATGVSLTPTYSWGAVSGATSYDIQVSTDAGFGSFVVNANVATNSYLQPTNLTGNTTYYWRVRAVNSCGNGSFSTAFSFTTVNLVCNTYNASTGLPLTIPNSGTVTASLSVADNVTITDVNVIDLRGTHARVNDLVVTLIHPDGTRVRLMNRVCTTTAQNFDIKFDDQASTATVPCPPTNGQFYIPNQLLSAFNTKPSNGTWQLEIQDAQAPNGGSLTAWGIQICGTPSCTVPDQPSTISGTTTPCQGSSQVYSVTNVAGVTYNWSFPAGWSQTAGGTTNSVTVTVGANSGNVTVTPSNACGNGTARSLSTTVNTVPTQPSTISGTTTPCQGSSQTYSVTSVAGVTYNWTFPSGWTQTGGGTTNSVTVTVGSTSGDVIVTPSNACGNGTARSLSTTVNTTPSISSHPSNTSVCTNANTSFSVTASNATSYQWQVNTGSGFTNITNGGVYSNVTTTTLTITGATVGMNGYSYRCVTTNSCGNTNSNNAQLTVSTSLTPSLNIDSNEGTSICSGTTVTFTASPTNGGGAPSYQWKLNTNNVGTNSNTYTNNSLNNGDLVSCVLTSSDACANPTTANSNQITMSVSAINNTVTLSGNVLTANQSGATYQWIDCNNGGAIISDENEQSFSPQEAGSYAVIVTTADCEITSDCINFSSLSIFDNTVQNLSIYPNPNTGTFLIDLGTNKMIGSVIVKDILGKVVFISEINNTTKIPISINTASGIYIATINNEQGQSLNLKFVVE